MRRRTWRHWRVVMVVSYPHPFTGEPVHIKVVPDQRYAWRVMAWATAAFIPGASPKLGPDVAIEDISCVREDEIDMPLDGKARRCTAEGVVLP